MDHPSLRELRALRESRLTGSGPYLPYLYTFWGEAESGWLT